MWPNDKRWLGTVGHGMWQCRRVVTNQLWAVTTCNDGGGWWHDDGAMARDRHGAWWHRQTVGNMLGVVMGCDDRGRRWWECHGVTQADKSEILMGRISYNSWAANIGQHWRIFHISWVSQCQLVDQSILEHRECESDEKLSLDTPALLQPLW
ncbi:hypothetical protein BJY52DRAFT_1220127 [Lactarius psammicola]|nr:hypothetical protein BJY52DRAFT_1220127 [Lactarius psammicola]